MLDLGADGYVATELATNAVSNAHIWHHQLNHLNKWSLELMKRHDGNGINFDGTIGGCHFRAVGKNHQLAHAKKA